MHDCHLLMCFAIKQNYFCAFLLLNAQFTFFLFHFKFSLKKYQACVLWESTRGGGGAIVSGLVTNSWESVQGHGAVVCGNWFGLANSLHMPQPAVAGWARPRGREEFLVLSRAMSNSIPTCHRGWEAWRNLEDNALSSLHKLLRRRGWGGTQFRWRDKHSGTLCIL